MRLYWEHPKVARRPCETCKTWWFDEATGQIVTRGGRPQKRQPGAILPCDPRGTGCPKVRPEGEPECKALSPENYQTYMHYLQCKATGHFPDDPLVARHAQLISMVEEQLKREQRQRHEDLLRRIYNVLAAQRNP